MRDMMKNMNKLGAFGKMIPGIRRLKHQKQEFSPIFAIRFLPGIF